VIVEPIWQGEVLEDIEETVENEVAD